ncbi:2,3-dihydro-2,3-dihydroxybenzoate dehydrogenase [Kitasatospora sp. NPDC096147]|uniref:2,3-dihydro-2,3-dihydroxybenzoate dehydrogenase n=1 Tax=Kitasatospora sp. NPDC096147 TaxID=3364093 RepID=UPI00382291D0
MAEDIRELDGRIALVTGAARGIGAAVARVLADRGAQVVATDIRTPHDDVTYLDVTDGAAVDALVDRVERETGPISILVNVAGILRPAPVLELTDEDWAETFAVNTTGVFHTCRAVGRRMAERGNGVVVTVGSNAAGVPRTRMAAYAASKAAAAMFTKVLGLELARDGVRCNLVSPGSTYTEMQRQFWTDEQSERRVVDGDPDQYRVGIPLGRIGAAEDVAEAVAFLVSDRARQITMHDLYVDGGATLRA